MPDDLAPPLTPRWVDAFPWVLGADAGTDWEGPAAVGSWEDARYARVADLALRTQRAHPVATVFPLLSADLRLKDLPLTPRLHNVLRRHRLHTGADLGTVTVEGLLSSMQVGPWTVRSIFRALAAASVDPPPASPDPDPAELDDPPPAAALERALAGLDARMAAILYRRLLAPVPTTLAALGSEFGVTRERVRQLEKRTLTVLGAPVGLDGPTFAAVVDAYRERDVDVAAVLGVELPPRRVPPGPRPPRSSRALHRGF